MASSSDEDNGDEIRLMLLQAMKLMLDYFVETTRDDEAGAYESGYSHSDDEAGAYESGYSHSAPRPGFHNKTDPKLSQWYTDLRLRYEALEHW